MALISINVGNSYSQLRGMGITQFNAVRKFLSYQADPQAAFFSGGGHTRLRFCIDKQGRFPTGLLGRVTAFLNESGTKFDLHDRRQSPDFRVNHSPKVSSVTPHKWQSEAVEFVAKEGRGIVSAPTGSGKSLVIALVTARLAVRTLIVVPSLQIKEQLTADLQRVFSDMSNITVENIDSTALKTASDYACLIIDEAHRVAAKTYQQLNKSVWNGIYYRVFTTATPFRNQTEETMLFEGIAGTAVYKLSYRDAVNSGYIVPVEAYYYDLPKRETEAYTYAEVYSELVVKHEERNQRIASLLFDLAAANKSTLCLVKEIKHGEMLADLTGFPFTNGQDEQSRDYIGQFSRGEIPVLIATEGLLGEGVDSRACEYVIIAGGGKAKSAFMQKVGRCVRRYEGKESGKVILFRDRSHKFLLRHFNEQKAILKDEYGIKPVKIGD